MIVSLSWLREFVDIPVGAATLAHDLTMHGIKVERLTATGLTERLVVVGRVLETRPHPDAERLRVCRVETGSGDPLEIVCGAANVAAGQKVAVALVGAKLPNGVKLRKSKIRGVASNGMICSEVELGLGSESGGIMVLPEDTAVGVPLMDVLGETDAMLELEVTPNRPDQLGHVGVAREIAALYRTGLRVPSPRVAAGEGEESPHVEIADADECFRFVARVIHGVTIGPSPAWLTAALAKVGLNSVNNIVDVTNYVMMELGQPMHAYDLKALPSTRMGVRRGRRGERLETLDAVTHELGEDHLVITSDDEPVGVAGVIGGMPTRITDSTTDLLLECAAFQPRAVRRTRTRLRITTDASYRFERGSDRAICRLASDRACELIARVAGGTAGAVVDEYPAPWPERAVSLRRSTVRRLLGEPLDVETIAGLLARIGFVHTRQDADQVTVGVPSFRWDVHEEADLVEEVARLHGYENIGKGWRYKSTVPSRPDPFDRFLERAASHLVARGHTEMITSAFTDGRELDWFDWADDDPRRHPIPLLNPLSSNHGHMRTHLLPGVLDALARNLAHDRREVYAFTIGRVFLRAPGAAGLPEEPTHLVVARTRPEGASFWRSPPDAVDLFEIKAELEALLETLRPDAAGDLSYDFEPSRGTFRYVNRRHTVAEGGIIPAAAAATLDIEQPVWFANVDLSALFDHAPAVPLFRPFSEYPASRRDLSLVAPRGVSWLQIEKNVAKAGGRLLESTRVFDVYRGESLGDGRIAYGVRLTFRSGEATLTDTEVDAVVAKVIAKLDAELGVVLRA